MIVLGTITLWLSPLLAAWAVLVGALARHRDRADLAESSRRAAIMQGPLLCITVASLATAFVQRDFSLAYVAGHSSRSLSPGFVLVAINAGWQGTLLVLLLVLSLLSIPRFKADQPSGPALLTLVLVLLGSGWLVTAGNLFARLPVTPLEGHGLDPKVRDFATLLESPLRIVAYATACTTAIGMIGPLLTMTRPKAGPNARWLLSSWLLLSVSLVVGLWHAYGTADARAVTDWGAARSLAALVWVILSILLWVTLRGRIRWLSPGSMSLFAGSVLLVTGLVGWSRGATTELRIKVGRMESVASLMGASYALTHMGVSRFETPDRFVSAATLDLKQDAKPAGLVTSERNQYFDLLGQPIGEPVTKVGVHRGVLEDLRVIYRESSSTEEALYRVELSPFAWLIWLGAGLLILGGLVLIPEVGS